MSAALPIDTSTPLRRDARWLLVAMHVPFIAFAVAQGGLSLAFPASSDHEAIAVALALTAGAIQLRHSLAAAAGLRPRYWRWSLAALVLIAYVPAPFFGARWATLQWFVLASVAMLFRGRLALASILVSVALHGSWFAMNDTAPDGGIGRAAWEFAYWAALQFLGSGGLYGATRLVHLLDALREARADLADLAVGRQRLRISRDLHDLLGQSLSAVSLKGDLAIGLLERHEVPRAISEIESLVAVARSALHDVLHVAHREPPIALSSEIDRAADLLASTGTETRVDIAVDALAPAIDELFAWSLREGVTNVLRHSSATTCTIRVNRHAGVARLEIVNDGAMPTSLGGNGLSGLATRAAALSGTASGRSIGDRTFRLTIEVPEVTT
ncbi:MAG TPA: histidine kinase [Gemmatimonadaceae bacterium]|nr:histidine kinase [Gemmatimonadaceae bacterium]